MRIKRIQRKTHKRDAVPPCVRGDTIQARNKNGSNSQVEKYVEFGMKLDASIPKQHSRVYVLGWSCFWQTEIPVPKERRNVHTLKFSPYDTESDLHTQIANPELFVDFQFSTENDNSNKLKQFTVNVSANVCDSLTFLKLQNFLLLRSLAITRGEKVLLHLSWEAQLNEVKEWRNEKKMKLMFLVE